MRRTASVTTLVNLETNYSPHKNKKQTKLRSEEHTSELQSQSNLVCRLLLEKKKTQSRDEDPGFADLPALDLDPLDRLASVVDLHAFAGRELPHGDGRFAVLLELALQLSPKC